MMLTIRCPVNSVPVPTGMRVDEKSLDTCRFSGNLISCQSCGKDHNWDKNSIIKPDKSPLWRKILREKCSGPTNIDRRELLKAVVSASVVACLVAANPAHAKLGRGGVIQTGLFPNSAPAFLPMAQVYPAPSGVASYEPHQFAYYRPSNGNTFQWRKRVIVAFGRWPFIYQLVSGPPGMAFEATTWNPAWDGQGDVAYQNGYGVLTWTPTAVTASTLVSVNVYDQDGRVLNIQWNIETSGDITSAGGSGVFFFLNADSGNDSTGDGSDAAPWQTPAHAFGTSWNTSGTRQGAAPAGSICVPQASTTLYQFPAYSDNNIGQADYFEWNATYKPCSIIGPPGANPTIDLSSGSSTIAGNFGGSPPGLFIQDITLSGYTATDSFVRPLSCNTRTTFQGVSWIGAGAGTGASSNPTMCYAAAALSSANYVSITGCSETVNTGTTNPNTDLICCLFSVNNFVVELNSASGPSGLTAYHLKQDCSNGSCRANFGDITGSGSEVFALFGTQYNNCFNVECTYNVVIGATKIQFPETQNLYWGNCLLARNNFIVGSLGISCAAPNNNLVAPYINGAAPFGYSIPASTTATTGGSLAAASWAYIISSKGVTGETGKINNNGGSEVLLTSTGSTSVNMVYFNGVPDVSGYRIWRGSGGSGSENQYTDIAAGTGIQTFTDNGTLTWTSGTLPTTNNAVSADRFIYNSNLVQTPTQSSDPSGNTCQSDGKSQYQASGLLNTTTGLLLTSNGGTVGAQLT